MMDSLMDTPCIYLIRVQGHLDLHWSAWFAPMQILHDSNGETILQGVVEDQAALHGVIAKIRDLGLVLLSVRRTDQEA